MKNSETYEMHTTEDLNNPTNQGTPTQKID